MAKKNAATNPAVASEKTNLPKNKIAVKPTATTSATKADHASMPLNKYLAHCGICSRRDAVAIITEGKVKVNGKAIIEPGSESGIQG
jgi:23S rRNA pseudouridine2605 synthase